MNPINTLDDMTLTKSIERGGRLLAILDSEFQDTLFAIEAEIEARIGKNNYLASARNAIEKHASHLLDETQQTDLLNAMIADQALETSDVDEVSDLIQVGMEILETLRHQHPDVFEAVMHAKETHSAANLANIARHAEAIDGQDGVTSMVAGEQFDQDDIQNAGVLEQEIKNLTNEILTETQQDRLTTFIYISSQTGSNPEANVTESSGTKTFDHIIEAGPKSPAERGEENSADSAITR